DQRIAARDDVADDVEVRLEGELLAPIAFDQLDAQAAQLIAHRRIDVRVAAGHGVAGLARQRCDTAHERAADTQDMNVHKGILGAAPWRLVPQRSTLRAASSVLAMSSSLCAALTKPASYSAGAKYTPRSSMPWKKRLKRSLSVA